MIQFQERIFVLRMCTILYLVQSTPITYNTTHIIYVPSRYLGMYIYLATLILMNGLIYS